MSRATMEQGLKGTVKTPSHQAVLLKFTAEDFVVVIDFLLLCYCFLFRTAPLPKYLKMHYVKEEIGDSKGVFECKIR